ncbi:hypothetical protein HC723_09895 [Vibrio sp. S11_S32]|uniref:hypothetical protein n=1 Tax=Vibrio sp. S11_S32 TaxID=2720225 RepID=UPI001680E6EA|nr:hypothetical protein [Vibrio sp. S11_S32]MBD1576748.1 hypothetical protein [Vibrio sp. S11_S32]
MSWQIEEDITQVSHNAAKRITTLELSGDVLTTQETNHTAAFAYGLERLTKGRMSRISVLNAIEHISKQLDASMKRELYAYITITGLERLALAEHEVEEIEPDPVKRVGEEIKRLKLLLKRRKTLSHDREQSINQSIYQLTAYREKLKDEAAEAMQPITKQSDLFNVGRGVYIQVSPHDLSRHKRGFAVNDNSNQNKTLQSQIDKQTHMIKTLRLSTDDEPPAPRRGRKLSMPLLSLEAKEQRTMTINITKRKEDAI